MPARPEAQGRAPLRAIPKQDECGEHALTDAVSLKLQRVLAPMHKRALGVATGLTAAAGVFALTLFHIAVIPGDTPPLSLLSQYFYGYDVTMRGAAIGAGWAFVAGFVAGWFFAFVRNLVMAIWVFSMRVRAEFNQTRDFLDHI